MPDKGRLFVQIVNKNGTPVDVTDNGELLMGTSTSGGGSGAVASEATLAEILEQVELGTTSTTVLNPVPGPIVAEVLQAANTNRKSLKIVNDTDNILYVREGELATEPASASLYTWKLCEGDTLIIDDYNGEVNGIWESGATGGVGALITETV